MTVNQSKINDPRQWEKWRKAGAVVDPYTLYDRKTTRKFNRILNRDGNVLIDAVGINFEKGLTTLSLSPRQVSKGISEPECYLVVPNGGFEPGQTLDKLPKGAVSVERIYGIEANTFAEVKENTLVRTNQIETPEGSSHGARYLQTNAIGYVIGITQEPILAGLYDGRPQDFRILAVNEAEEIQRRLNERHSEGEGLHIDEL